MKYTLVIKPICLIVATSIYMLGIADEEIVDGVTWRYTVKTGEVTIDYGDGEYSGDVSVPSSLGGYPVTHIGPNAFWNCTKLTSVRVPPSVVSVDDYAFGNCNNLISVMVCEGTKTICHAAFHGCHGLRFVYLPSSITNIDESAFNSCSELMSVTMPPAIIRLSATFRSAYSTITNVVICEGVTNISNDAFSSCVALRSVRIPEGVTSIGDRAFSGCLGLESVAIPEGVESIGSEAFSGCAGLTSITIPRSVQSIGASAFSACSSLTNIVLPFVGLCRDNTGTPDSLFGYIFGHWTSSGSTRVRQFYTSELFVDYYIPSSLREVKITDEANIGYGAFYGCSGLTLVTMPSTLTSIGDYGFYHCSGLASLSIPYGLTRIGTHTFEGCNGVTRVDISNLANWCGFAYENKLANPLYYAEHLYLNGEEVKDLAIPASVTSIPDYAFCNLSGLISVDIPESVTNIGVSAFEGCASLIAVSIPSSVIQIGTKAFSGCNALRDDDGDGYIVLNQWLVGYCQKAKEEIYRPDEIIGVVGGALSGCKSIKRLEFSPASVLEAIGDEAFGGCTELQKMTLPHSLKKIGVEAFMGCSYLDNVIIPGSVRTVGDRAFKNCTGFTAVLIEHGVESLGDECFYGDWQIKEVDLPSTVSEIGKSAFGGDSTIVRIALRGDCRAVKEIFSNYGKITEATVRHGDGELAIGLFLDCKALKVVHFQGDAPKLPPEASVSGLVYIGNPEIYEGTPSSLITYVEPASTGWDGTPGSHALPQQWPLRDSFRRSIAVWDMPTYLCQFDSNGGSLGVQDTYQYSEQKIVLPPEPEQSGYRFSGWWTHKVGGLQVTENTIFIEGVYAYLYAHWVKEVAEPPVVCSGEELSAECLNQIRANACLAFEGETDSESLARKAIYESAKKILVDGPKGSVGIIAEMGISPAFGTVDETGSLRLTYSMPSLRITSFDAQTGVVRFKVVPGDGNQIVSELATGYLHVYGTNALGEKMKYISSVGFDLAPYLKPDTMGEGVLNVSLGSQSFFKIKVESVQKIEGQPE